MTESVVAESLANVTLWPIATVCGAAILWSLLEGGLKGSTRHFILEDEMEWMRWSGDMFEVLMQWRRRSCGSAGGDWASVWQAVIVDLFSGYRPGIGEVATAWGDTSCAEAAFPAGIDAFGARGDFARHSGGPIDALDSQVLVRAPSTVSREIKRNGGYDRYRPAAADENAWRRGRRPKGCKLANNRWLRRTVARKLELDWSPKQIAGWFKRAYPEDEHYQVSPETIYRSLYVQARGILKNELIRHLPQHTLDVGDQHRRLLLRSKVRGSWFNENTNGLLRQYLPKGTDLSCTRKPAQQSGAAAQRTTTQRLCDLQPQPNDLMLVLHRPLSRQSIADNRRR